MRIALAMSILAVTIGEGVAFAQDRPVPVTIDCHADGKSTAPIVAGERVDDPVSPASSGAIARLIPNKHARIVFINGTDGTEMSYQCLGGMIYTLQMLGYDRLELVSEPPVAGSDR
ncbi:hypothetical protein [Sphingomonas sp.]|uniref:hypothetical protein n=1 Tax=Sphingomonas sp. TaxID=28214 RepID=UPI003D6D061D